MNGMTISEPRYPKGTPEYAAYAAELKVELGKFERGKEPYPYGQTTGQRAIELLQASGFRTIDRIKTLDGHDSREMSDITGRRIRLVLGYGTMELIKAIPMGQWVRDIERAYPAWPNQPYVTTVTQLECVLATPGVMR